MLVSAVVLLLAALSILLGWLSSEAWLAVHVHDANCWPLTRAIGLMKASLVASAPAASPVDTASNRPHIECEALLDTVQGECVYCVVWS